MFLVWTFFIQTCLSCWRLSASILPTLSVLVNLESKHNKLTLNSDKKVLVLALLLTSLNFLCVEISDIIIGGPGGGKRCPVFCAGWPMDPHSVPRCHIELCDPREEQPRADWLLFSAGRQCPSSSQCGSGSVDGHSTITYSCLLQSDCWGKLLSEETSYSNRGVNQLDVYTFAGNCQIVPPERAARGFRVLLYSRKLLIDVFLGLNGPAISSKMVLKLHDLHSDLRTVPTVPSLINT